MYQTLPLRTILAATGASDITTCHCCHILHWEVLTNSMKGRGGCTKTSQNPGIAKKGEGGSDPCKDFFGGFDIAHRGHRVIMDPPYGIIFSQKVTMYPQMANFFKNQFLPQNMIIYALLLSKCRESHLRSFAVKSTRLPALGGGGSSKSWQCQDFESFCIATPP